MGTLVLEGGRALFTNLAKRCSQSGGATGSHRRLPGDRNPDRVYGIRSGVTCRAEVLGARMPR